MKNIFFFLETSEIEPVRKEIVEVFETKKAAPK